MDTMSISPSVQASKHWTQCLQRISGLGVTLDQGMSTHTHVISGRSFACEAGLLAGRRHAMVPHCPSTYNSLLTAPEGWRNEGLMCRALQHSCYHTASLQTREGGALDPQTRARHHMPAFVTCQTQTWTAMWVPAR